MADTLNNLHVCPFELTAGADIAVVDSFSSRTVTVPAGWYRHGLADPMAAGTSHETAKEFLHTVEDLLNAAPAAGFWSVQMLATGYVKTVYVGGTGAASLTWTSPIPRNLMGFAGTLNFAAPAASETAPSPPTHCLFAVAKGDDDSDWAPAPAGFAACVTAGGVVDVLTDGVALVVRRTQLINVPRRTTDRTARGMAGTPMLPEDDTWTRLLSPSGTAVAAGAAPPWTIHQHVWASAGKLCAFTDDVQGLFAGSTDLYEVGYLHPETLLSMQAMKLVQPGLRALVTRMDWAMTLTGREELP